MTHEYIPAEGDFYRPLIAQEGRFVLAGGWCRFDLVQVINDQMVQVVPGEALQEMGLLDRFTDPRKPIAGMDMSRPNVMGILNVTPDSFSDGGQFAQVDAAVAQAMQMVQDGATILDIGGESTRPGALEVAVEEELDRVIPVVEGIRASSDIPISIDTRKAQVAQAALAAGANLINDVSAFTFDPAMAQVAVQAKAPACLMHAQGLPETMQLRPAYRNVVNDVHHELSDRVIYAQTQGMELAQIMIDPGIGFGKTMDHNLALLKNLSALHGLGCPILLGASRKKFIGTLSGVDLAADRMAGSIAVALAGVAEGAQILRVHDVAETVQALRVQAAISG